MARQKTALRHISKDGQVTRVTKENEAYFIGDTNERAEGKMMHHKAVGRAKHVREQQKQNRPDHALNNPYYGQGQGEWDDYAHTADDL